LIGGCLESLEHLRGTPWWPDMTDAILFLESSEEQPAPATIDAILTDYDNMGVFERIAGLLFANPYGYSDDQRCELREVILERTDRYHFPIVADMEFGHTQPMFLIPLGCAAEIDSSNRRFEILESAVNP
jgi:muramoyltetrapeptide carboxypeptidase LdcA involved in peptidoglycan recycling